MFFFFFFFTDKTNDSPEISKFDNAEWQQTANKGEWSELYTLYKLLADQNLYPFDKEQKLANVCACLYCLCSVIQKKIFVRSTE